MYRYITLLIVLALNLCGSAKVYAAGSTLEGFVFDAVTGEPLLGANVMLMGTSLGGATDFEGKFVIQSVTPGNYTIRVSYIGYKEEKSEIKVSAGKNERKDFRLEPVGIEGDTVIVTAQAIGQKQAINKQLTSDQIVNVVSAAKIQELPDANAAESVGRLPGVSIQRNGGEGAAVVIRGMSPKYNGIMINGIRMSSTSSDDRGTDLSMVSSNMLDGIEVSKTVTPDMDADVIGGTVNFELREARVKESGVPVYNFKVQGGYNNLSNAYNKLNNYKYSGSIENRFFNDRFGVFFQLDAERKNLWSNEMGASYTNKGNSQTEYLASSLNLNDISRDRTRYNGTLVLDYIIPDGKIKLTNFFNTGKTDIVDRGESYDIISNQHSYGVTSSNIKLNVINNSIDYQQQVSIFNVNARLSHAYSETKNPNNWNVNFLQTSAGLGGFINVANVIPTDIPKAANNNLASTLLNTLYIHNSFSKERSVTAALDLNTLWNISDLVSAKIKFGGKFSHLTRSYDYDEYTGGFKFGDASYLNDLIISSMNLPPASKYNIPVSYFIDKNYSYGKFLDGDYPLNTPLDYSKLAGIVDIAHSNIAEIIAHNGQAGFGHNNLNSTTFDYSGYENQSALYVMTTLNIGSEITVIPGVRYQNLQTSYKGVRGVESRLSYDSYNHYDTTIVKDHGYLLPDVALRYKPFSWFDLRMSFTNTLAYPDYNAVIPRINVGKGVIAWNNFNIVPSRCTNYDVYMSFYDNTIGLFTIGGFYKEIKDLIYSWTFYATGADILNYYPISLVSGTTPTGTYQVTTYMNNPYKIKDYGLELEWQTHFWYLPGVLSGLVFNVNYTHIYSKAQYPLTIVESSGRTVKYINTYYEDRLLDQPNDIINLSLGFDYRDFSARVSLLYQSDIFSGANLWQPLKAHTATYRRWDISAKQGLPWFGIELFGDINNINGAKDVSIIQGGGVPMSQQDYGLTADFGFRVKF